MKLACYSLVLGEGYTVPAVIDILKKYGYDGVEWRVRDDYHIPLLNIEEKAVEIKAACDAAGLEIPALATYLHISQTEEVSNVLKAAAIMGCESVRLLAPIFDGSRHYLEILTKAKRDLARLEPLCKDSGVKATIELHFGHIAPSASAGLRLVEDCSPDCIGIIYDPGNMIYEGMENWQLGIQLLGDYLTHIHIKNSGWFYSEELGWKAGVTRLQEGIIDWQYIITLLHKEGYAGWLSLEDFFNIPVEEKLEVDADFIRQYIKSAETIKNDTSTR